ncbi:DUF5689 domain-containing protein [Salinimicrobium oceani]|uniref:DUF5689 domain-containing protein n=1 Tax=Salinimicrobium oceani TaxID=2722702 RepID=A0ABX1CX81_9FLAO|nr:DUF5689 domain-containing protein [Salinimicrobium oceani]NJW52900.1 hypothetical protein [Salinimicrobium oceani]
MKKLLLFPIFIIAAACSPEDEFSVPEAKLSADISTQVNTDLNAVLGLFYQQDGEVITFNEDLILEAYVVSSDEAGNFYKELVVQDKKVDPRAGLNIKINMASYYQFYNFGRKVYINLKGLSLGVANGVPALGTVQGKQIGNIPQSRIAYHLIRDTETATIVPKKITSSDFSDQLENLYVEIENVQFNKIHVDPANPFTYASEANDEFDGERMVESCGGDFPFILSTSTYADFRSLKLPQGSGNLRGILTRDYYDKFYTIYLNSSEDVNFSNNSRCDKMEFSCENVSLNGSKILFEEDFSNQKNNKPVEGKGWKNIVQEGSRPWEAYTATGANASLGRSARMRPSGSGDVRSISWLITPRINFDSSSGEVLSFKTSTSFANGSMLEVLFSNNWDGNEETLLRADWQILSAAYVANNNDFFGDWISSGLVDLSCASGKGYIAFKYIGSDLPYYNGVYELDDIKVSAE